MNGPGVEMGGRVGDAGGGRGNWPQSPHPSPSLLSPLHFLKGEIRCDFCDRVVVMVLVLGVGEGEGEREKETGREGREREGHGKRRGKRRGEWARVQGVSLRSRCKLREGIGAAFRVFRVCFFATPSLSGKMPYNS